MKKLIKIILGLAFISLPILLATLILISASTFFGYAYDVHANKIHAGILTVVIYFGMFYYVRDKKKEIKNPLDYLAISSSEEYKTRKFTRTFVVMLVLILLLVWYLS